MSPRLPTTTLHNQMAKFSPSSFISYELASLMLFKPLCDASISASVKSYKY